MQLHREESISMRTVQAVASYAPSRDLSNNSPLLWWHLLSLDAPTIAGLWCWSFGHAFGVSLPWFGVVTLCLGTWCVYVADRLLDGWNKKSDVTLRERHIFYLCYRHLFLWALTAAALPLAYFILVRVSARVRKDDLLLALIGCLYFSTIRTSLAQKWIPKEIVVGVLFAVATALPCWSRLPTNHAWMLACSIIFAALCCWNCVAIQIWEDDRSAVRTEVFPHTVTSWAGRHLRPFAICLAVLPAAMSIFSPAVGIQILLASCSLSGILFLLMDHYGASLQARTMRIGADLALLTPLMWIWMIR